MHSAANPRNTVDGSRSSSVWLLLSFGTHRPRRHEKFRRGKSDFDPRWLCYFRTMNWLFGPRSNADSVRCKKHSYPDQRDKSERHKRGPRHKLPPSRTMDRLSFPFSALFVAFTGFLVPMTSALAPATCRCSPQSAAPRNQFTGEDKLR